MKLEIEILGLDEFIDKLVCRLSSINKAPLTYTTAEEPEKPVKAEKANPVEKEVTISDVRLAATRALDELKTVSREELLAILVKHGGSKLSEIPAENYAALVEEIVAQ